MNEPPELSTRKLSRQGLSARAIEVAVQMTVCIADAAEDVARDTDDDVSFDDATGRGQLLYRRARRRMIVDLATSLGVQVDDSKNTLEVSVDEIVMTFYSATDGVDQPLLAGSATKQAVVDEMQMQLDTDETVASLRLVLFHKSDEDGLVEASLGVMRTKKRWSWRVTMFDRFASRTDVEVTPDAPAYDEQKEAELPPITRRDEEGEDELTVSAE